MTQAMLKAATLEPIAFVDLQAQRRRLGGRIDDAIGRVLDHGKFIMGPEVAELEARLAAHCGAKHVVGCSSGTDALVLGLMALGVRPGDAVFVPSFTFAATAEAVALLGATPVFVDILSDTFNMDPTSLKVAIAAITAEDGFRPAGIIPVDLFGQPAHYPAIEGIAAEHGLWVMADAAQSYGASLNNRRVGTFGRVAVTSFFPAKPLGCYGDGGAVFTDDDDLAAVLRSLLFHGKGSEKYDNVRIGMNGRLDTIQAAILIQKLAIFDEEMDLRQQVAGRYGEGLGDLLPIPSLLEGATSAWAQYTLVVDKRDAIAARLKAQGIPSAIYYPRPLHQQTAYRAYPCAPDGLPVSEELSSHVLSLPMHPYLEKATQDRIVAAVRDAALG